MCGLAGLVTKPRELGAILERAQRAQAHRGPDGEGWLELSCGKWNLGAAHSRLAVLDLSDAAGQPMQFGNRGYLFYNGEVYNYLELKAELQQVGVVFRTASDTEVVLAALHHWGIAKALQRFNGMFSLAWLDTDGQRLVLARDRLGIKPLYYCLQQNQLYFASEIKGILEMSSHRFPLNFQVVGEYLLQSLLDSSLSTFFTGIEAFPPGHYAIIDLSQPQLELSFDKYWELVSQPVTGQIAVPKVSEEIRDLFIDAVSLRLRSDVPVGILLSGGIDSSAIAAVADRLRGGNREVSLLSAVSLDPRFDETPYIAIMENHLGRRAHRICLDPDPGRLFSLLEEACWYNDEPIGSLANVAHYQLMEVARDLGVTVILSGQGADELLCGYRKYYGFWLQQMYRTGGYASMIAELIFLLKQGTVLKQFSWAEGKRYLPGLFNASKDVRGEALRGFIPRSVGLLPGMTVQKRQALDVCSLSVPALLHYEDRMSMAWSREIRVPFLDHRLVEKMVSLPVNLKLHQGWTKWIFRQAMQPYLPAAIAWRKDKQGFVNPQGEWLKNELKEKVLEYFAADSLIFRYQLVDRDRLLSLYHTYCRQRTGQGNIWFREIFNPLALEIWLRKYERYIT